MELQSPQYCHATRPTWLFHTILPCNAYTQTQGVGPHVLVFRCFSIIKRGRYCMHALYITSLLHKYPFDTVHKSMDCTRLRTHYVGLWVDRSNVAYCLCDLLQSMKNLLHEMWTRVVAYPQILAENFVVVHWPGADQSSYNPDSLSLNKLSFELMNLNIFAGILC